MTKSGQPMSPLTVEFLHAGSQYQASYRATFADGVTNEGLADVLFGEQPATEAAALAAQPQTLTFQWPLNGSSGGHLVRTVELLPNQLPICDNHAQGLDGLPVQHSVFAVGGGARTEVRQSFLFTCLLFDTHSIAAGRHQVASHIHA